MSSPIELDSCSLSPSTDMRAWSTPSARPHPPSRDDRHAQSSLAGLSAHELPTRSRYRERRCSDASNSGGSRANLRRRRGACPTSARFSRCFALVTATALALVALSPASAFAISRNSVLARAQTRVDSPVKYSQKRHYLGYRTDCSGYVSMCWKTETSWSTRSFNSVTRRISASQLKPGDALLKKGLSHPPLLRLGRRGAHAVRRLRGR